MTCSSTAVPAIAITRAGTLSTKAAFYLLASITVSFLAGSAAPTPLYPLYQAKWGFSPVTVTIVFGVYAIAVLVALLVAGRLSDHVGRKPVLMASILTQIATMLLFAVAADEAALIAARILQGLATGAAVAAVGAGLLELDKARGTTANAIAPMLGTATGAITAGLAVQYLPAPTHLIYLVLGGVFALQMIGVGMMAETTALRPGAVASLVPQFNFSAAVRVPFLIAVPVLVATWALAGFYASLGPSLVRTMTGSHSYLIGGLVLFVIAGSAVISVLSLQQRDAGSMMVIGTALLIAGTATVVASLPLRSVTGFFIGSAVAGLGFGGGFQGAVRSVVAHAAPRDRAGVLSVIFVVSYLAMGAPAVAAGYSVALLGNIFATARDFGVFVMILSALALAGAMLRRSTARVANAASVPTPLRG